MFYLQIHTVLFAFHYTHGRRQGRYHHFHFQLLLLIAGPVSCSPLAFPPQSLRSYVKIFRKTTKYLNAILTFSSQQKENSISTFTNLTFSLC